MCGVRAPAGRNPRRAIPLYAIKVEATQVEATMVWIDESLAGAYTEGMLPQPAGRRRHGRERGRLRRPSAC